MARVYHESGRFDILFIYLVRVIGTYITGYYRADLSSQFRCAHQKHLDGNYKMFSISDIRCIRVKLIPNEYEKILQFIIITFDST